MARENLSRRRFLSDVAAGSTGAALATMPGVLTAADAGVAAAKQLRWIQWGAAGVESILWPELVDSPIVLTNMQRIYSPVISESAIGLMLALARGFPQYTLQTRERRWQTVPGLVEISGMTLGLVGLGGIGTDTAYRAHYGFNMNVLA